MEILQSVTVCVYDLICVWIRVYLLFSWTGTVGDNVIMTC